jgi:hypothetical protein
MKQPKDIIREVSFISSEWILKHISFTKLQTQNYCLLGKEKSYILIKHASSLRDWSKHCIFQMVYLKSNCIICRNEQVPLHTYKYQWQKLGREVRESGNLQI